MFVWPFSERYGKGYKRQPAPLGMWLFRPNLCQANRFTLCCCVVFNYCISWHRGGLCVAICIAYCRINSLSRELLFAPWSPHDLQLDEKKKKIIKPSCFFSHLFYRFLASVCMSGVCVCRSSISSKFDWEAHIYLTLIYFTRSANGS